VTIEHEFGSTTIEQLPVRVVTVGYVEQDAMLALGVVPVGVREWFGEYPGATWPWASDRLGDELPTVLPAGELPLEQVAALEPDLIVGLAAGLTEPQYEQLSAIAPTIGQSADYPPYSTPWDVMTTTLGAAVGQSDLADSLVAGVQDRFAELRDEHPEFEGLKAAMAYLYSDSEVRIYSSADVRGQIMGELGFVLPAALDDLADGGFVGSLSRERLEELDLDVVVWGSSNPDVTTQIADDPLYRTLAVSTEGRSVFLGDVQSGAISFGSVLSIPYLLDSLVPQLTAAVDGDPATEVPAGH